MQPRRFLAVRVLGWRLCHMSEKECVEIGSFIEGLGEVPRAVGAPLRDT